MASRLLQGDDKNKEELAMIYLLWAFISLVGTVVQLIWLPLTLHLLAFGISSLAMGWCLALWLLTSN